MSIIGIFFVFVQIARGAGAESAVWDYTDKRGQLDPQHWYLNYEVCNGTRQSPINIDCTHIYDDQNLKPLTFQNYDKPVQGLLMHNDGHTIKIDVPATAGLRLLSDSLPAPYRLSQFHFHWGTLLKGGSEHTIKNKRWPLEMHLVHVNENIPANQTTIDKNGIVVVSVLFDHKNLQNSKQPTDLIEFLSTSASKVINEGNQTTLPDLVIGNILPENHTDNYLRYSGSLTTPPCAEVVEWIILTRTMTTTLAYMTQFRRTKQRLHDGSVGVINDKEVDIKENDRPLQPLNARPIRLMGDLGTSIPKCKTTCTYY